MILSYKVANIESMYAEYLNEKQWSMRENRREEEKRVLTIWNNVQKEMEEPKV